MMPFKPIQPDDIKPCKGGTNENASDDVIGDAGITENDVIITTKPVPKAENRVSFLKTSPYVVYVFQQICLNVGVACGCLYTAAHIVKVLKSDV